MDRLTITQRIEMIETYCKNGDSATATYRGLHNHPTTQTICKIVDKFDETGVVTTIERRVHHRFACSAENIVI